MSINRSGKWWVGHEPNDLLEYLLAYAKSTYPVEEFRLARCNCRSITFALHADRNEGVALRTCTSCKKQHFICDSGEYWSDAEPEEAKCVSCGTSTVNIGVGFALYADKEDVHWIYIGVRCVKCGVLGCFAEWKVGYSPSLQLIARA